MLFKPAVKQIQVVSQSLAPCRGGGWNLQLVMAYQAFIWQIIGWRGLFLFFFYTTLALLSSSSLLQSDLFVSNAVPTHVPTHHYETLDLFKSKDMDNNNMTVWLVKYLMGSSKIQKSPPKSAICIKSCVRSGIWTHASTWRPEHSVTREETDSPWVWRLRPLGHPDALQLSDHTSVVLGKPRDFLQWRKVNIVCLQETSWKGRKARSLGA